MIVVNGRFLTQNITGVQRYAIEICIRLKEIMGNDLHIVTPPNIVQTDYFKKLNATSIGSNKGHLWEQLDLSLFLKKHGNPLLLCLCNTAPLFYKNKIVTLHDIAFEIYPQSFSKSFLLVYKFLIPRIVKSCKHVITVSEFSKNEICSNYKIDRGSVSIIPNAVNDIFHHIHENNENKSKYFLAVSSLNIRKNFFSVLKAFKIFNEKRKDYNLFVIGDVNSKSFSKIDLSEYLTMSSIHFLGRVSDDELIKYYSNAVGFLYPSLYEGFGIPPLEAQKCECPVLCSDIPVLNEVCKDSVVYCNPLDIFDIANKMELLINKQEDLRIKGLQNVSRFSWWNSAQMIGKILEEQL